MRIFQIPSKPVVSFMIVLVTLADSSGNITRIPTSGRRAFCVPLSTVIRVTEGGGGVVVGGIVVVVMIVVGSGVV